tara:strand:+ start:430 stop:612 length:183 start_codon:yes stop_codon:yes gene_type:complete
MKRAFNQEAVRNTLQDGINKGYWTLQNLDDPSPGFKSNMNVRHIEFPKGYRGVRFKNLLR